MALPPDRSNRPVPDQQLVRALDHPVRVSLLKLLAQRASIRPSEALALLNTDDLALSNIAYHAWVLEHLELIEPAGEPDRRGTPFRATSKGEDALMTLGLSS